MLIGHTSMLNDNGMAAYAFLGIFMPRKVLGLLSKVSCDLTKPTKVIQNRKMIF